MFDFIKMSYKLKGNISRYAKYLLNYDKEIIGIEYTDCEE
jgi:hypothetical protein